MGAITSLRLESHEVIETQTIAMKGDFLLTASIEGYSQPEA